MNYILIGENIRAHRKRRMLSQEKLAEMIDVTPTYIGSIERAQRHPSLTTLVNIANALGATVDVLLLGILHYDTGSYQEVILELVHDCTPYERRIIFLSIEALKFALREMPR